jgi:chemotaxis protein CheC
LSRNDLGKPDGGIEVTHQIGEHDILTEVVNIGMGKAADSLSQLIGERICLSVPGIVVCEPEELSRILGERSELLDTSVVQEFEGSVSGRAVLAFPRASGVKLGQVLAGLDETPGELDLDLSEILEEVGNIVLNGVLGSIGNMLDTGLAYSVPRLYKATDVRQLVTSPAGEECTARTQLLADTRFEVSSRRISGSLLIMFGLGSIETVIAAALEQVTQP